MSKHTPGPWWAEMQLSRSGESLGWIINHPNGRIGWSSFATATPNKGEGPPHTQGGHNARLMAAAPEMYALIDRLLDADELFHEYREMALAVMAKLDPSPSSAVDGDPQGDSRTKG